MANIVDKAVSEYLGMEWAEKRAEGHRKTLARLVVQLTAEEVAEYVRRTTPRDQEA